MSKEYEFVVNEYNKTKSMSYPEYQDKINNDKDSYEAWKEMVHLTLSQFKYEYLEGLLLEDGKPTRLAFSYLTDNDIKRVHVEREGK